MIIKNAINKSSFKPNNQRYYQCFLAAVSIFFTTASLAVTVNDGWVAIQDDASLADPKSLEIEAGSILDFSTVKPNTAITSESQRLIINNEGKFARKSALTKPLKFLIASPSFDIRTNGFPSKTDIDRHIRQYKMHGYNMVRFHFLEYLLMYKRQADFDYDPAQLDRFFYFVSELKKNGIYLIVDGLSAPNGGFGDAALNGYYWDRYIDQKGLKFGVYFDPVAQQHWRDLVRTMYGSVNPYTNKTTLQDPVLAGLILVNENNLIASGNDTVVMNQQFTSWLLIKYSTQAALIEAWGSALVGNENIETGLISVPAWGASPSKKMADAQQFYAETQKNTADWMTSYVNSLGYQGPVTSYHFFTTLNEQMNRGQFKWIDMHNYSAQEYYNNAGQYSIPQNSMLGDNAYYIQQLASAQYLGKPFTVSEHGQVAWNQYRREAGLALPAYASFQGWEGICQHSNSVHLSYAEPVPGFKTIVGPYSVGYDPISRATETLAALLYLRGDVQPAQYNIGANLSTSDIYNKSYWQESAPLDVSKLSLVTGLGLDLDQQMRNKVLAGTILTPYTAQVDVYKPRQLTLFSQAGDTQYVSPITTDNWAARVQNLRDANLINAANKTNTAPGIYETDTGELLLDSSKKQLTVKTLKTEAAVFEAISAPLVINNFSVKSADAAAMVSVSAMDLNTSGKITPLNLASSKRMLVVLSTDAQNSGMNFTDSSGTTPLVNGDLGTQPILIKPVNIKLALKNVNSLNNGVKLNVYSVDLRGKRRDSIAVTKTGCNITATRPVATKCTGIEFDLDVRNLSHGATTYFEIATN